ncbi:hypothetical protein HWV62_18826 [Athelia sp. TMB]|nr:hypothetical protein HWV62_18826 [Athelia sp. TMB]
MSSDSSRKTTPLAIPQERSETIKPTKRHRPQALTQTHPAPSFASQRSASTSSSGSNQPHTPSVGAFRAHIHQLMPKHTLFHVRVHVHQLASVPLVKGEFGVRWKFKKTKSRKDHRRLDKTKGRDEDGEVDSDGEDGEDHADDDRHHDGSGDDAFNYGSYGSQLNLNGNGSHVNIPAVVVSNGHHSTLASVASTRPASPNPYAQFLASDWLPQSFLQHTHSHGGAGGGPQSTTSLSATTPPGAFVHARGMTPYHPLQEHNVTFEQTLNVVVQMDVNRDTMDLLPNELKLVVMQRVIPGDIDAPHNPRLGAVYLNLAEYANAGPVTRRYLLCQSRTNATLKLTIELEHIGGESKYKAPPLPKGEVLGGIAGILDSDVYKTRPRALDLYGMYYDPKGGHNPRFVKPAHSRAGSKTVSSSINGSIDISSLSSAYGPRTTETLIEAIFNPVPSHVEKPSPFTYYVPFDEHAQAQRAVSGSSTSGRTGSDSVRDGSVRSMATSSGRSGVAPSFETRSVRSISSQSHGSSHGHGQGVGEYGNVDDKRRWWRKIGNSRPSTPVM